MKTLGTSCVGSFGSQAHGHRRRRQLDAMCSPPVPCSTAIISVFYTVLPSHTTKLSTKDLPNSAWENVINATSELILEIWQIFVIVMLLNRKKSWVMHTYLGLINVQTYSWLLSWCLFVFHAFLLTCARFLCINYDFIRLLFFTLIHQFPIWNWENFSTMVLQVTCYYSCLVEVYILIAMPFGHAMTCFRFVCLSELKWCTASWSTKLIFSIL